MKNILVKVLFIAILLCSQSGSSHAITLSADDVKFLRSCGIEQADIDIIPNLPADGCDTLEILLESPRKKCELDIITSFKQTRKFVRMHTPPPAKMPEIPARYKRYFITVAEQVYIGEIWRKDFERTKKELEAQQNRGK